MDVAVGFAIMMMSSRASKVMDWLRRGELSGKLLGSEGRAIVSEEGLNNDSKVSAHQLVVFFGLQGLMGVEMRLKLDVNVIGRVIHEDTATGVHIILVRLPFRAEQTTFC